MTVPAEQVKDALRQLEEAGKSWALVGQMITSGNMVRVLYAPVGQPPLPREDEPEDFYRRVQALRSAVVQTVKAWHRNQWSAMADNAEEVARIATKIAVHARRLAAREGEVMSDAQLEIVGGNSVMLTIHPDGTITPGPGLSPDEATQQIVRQLGSTFVARIAELEAENARLLPVVKAVATIGVVTDTPEFMERNYGPLFFSVAHDLAAMKQQARAALEDNKP